MFYVKANPEKKDAEGNAVQVFDPDRNDFLSEEGRAVPESMYWVRLLAHGDVVNCDEKSTKAEAKAKAEAEAAAAAKTAKRKKE